MYKLYCTLILPYLTYGIILWGNANKDALDRILKLQKRAVRIISNSSYLCHTKPLFERFNMLDVNKLYKKELSIFMYKYHHSMLPRSFNNMFTNMKNVHNYDTRNKESYRSEIHKLTDVMSLGPRLWNSLPSKIKAAKSISQFKNAVVKHLNNSV